MKILFGFLYCIVIGWVVLSQFSRPSLFDYGLLALLSIPFVFSALSEIRRDHRWSGNALVKLLLGVLPPVLIVLMQISYTSYQSYCRTRIGPSAVLKGCDLSKFDLSHQNLTRTDLSDASLEGANLRQADLTEANLTNTNLRGADLTDTVLDRIIWANTNIVGVVGLSDEKLASALSVTLNQLPKTLQQHVIMDYPEDIRKSLKGVCLGTPAPGTHLYTPAVAFHPLVVLDSNGELLKDWPYGKDESESLEPPALRFTELVACVGENVSAQKREVTECWYGGGSSYTLYNIPRKVRIVAASSATVVAEKLVFARTPSCPERLLIESGKPTPGYISENAGNEDVLALLIDYAYPLK